MIPIKLDEEGNVEEVTHAYNPFMRGVMEFDDYNYTVHNPYILVEDPRYVEDEAPTQLDGDRKKTLATPPPQPKTPRPPISGPSSEPALSQKNIDINIVEDYKHDLILVKPSEAMLEKQRLEREAQIAEEELAKEKARKEAEKQKRKGGSKASVVTTSVEEETVADGEADDASKVDEGDHHDEKSDDDEDYSYRVFFRKEEIRMASDMQRKDLFSDLVSLRQTAR